MAQVTTSTTVHDVVVIGSGAGGGTVTKVLADLGVSVLLHGSRSDARTRPTSRSTCGRTRCRIAAPAPKGQAYTGGPTGFTYSATFGGAQLEGEPYTVAPGSDFSWFRSRMLGGRTNHYGRVTLRLADYDFKPKTTRRPRLRLADQLRGHGAVLRQGRALHRRHRHGRRASAARRTASSTRRRRSARTTSLVQRSCAKLGIRAVAGAPGGHDRRAQRPARRATTAASAAAAA